MNPAALASLSTLALQVWQHVPGTHVTVVSSLVTCPDCLKALAARAIRQLSR